MKMIKKGILPKDKLWRGSCRNCKAEFEATENEINPQDTRDGVFAIADCSYCSSKGQVMLYPVTKSS